MPAFEIIPAIMPTSFADLSAKADLVYQFVKSIHVDCMDGTLTPPVNWPFSGDAGEFRKLTSGELSLPYWRGIAYEVDIMTQNPEDSIAEWVNAGFHRIIIHPESTQKFSVILNDWKNVVEIGAAFSVDGSLDEAYALADAEIDFVQFMGIEHIGFQGNPFSPTVLEKVRKMRSANPTIPISVDGGVNFENAADIVRAGATRLIVGSTIFKRMRPVSKKTEVIQESAGPEITEIANYDEMSGKSDEMSAQTAIKKLQELCAGGEISPEHKTASGPIDIKFNRK